MMMTNLGLQNSYTAVRHTLPIDKETFLYFKYGKFIVGSLYT
jgi:hypothetical protein